MTQDTKDGILRNLPDTEEAQHVVDTDGVEILSHPAKPAVEPVYQILTFRFLFFTPIISWESPILTIMGENIRRRTGLGIEMEEFWMSGRLHTIPIHPNRHITLNDNSLRTGIIGSRFQLEVKVILEIINHLHWLLQPQCIRFQPILIIVKPSLELFGVKRLLTTF